MVKDFDPYCSGWPRISEEEGAEEGGEGPAGTRRTLAGLSFRPLRLGSARHGGRMGASNMDNGDPGSYALEYAVIEAWLDEHSDFLNDYFIRKGTRHMVDAWLMSHTGYSSPSPSEQNPGVGASQTTTTFASSTITHAGQGQGQSLGQNQSQGQSGGTGSGSRSGAGSGSGSGSTTPVRKISATEFEKGGLLTPIVTTVDGCPTFLTPPVDTIRFAAPFYLSIFASGSLKRSPNNSSRKVRRRGRAELRSLNERELIFELVKDICNELDIQSLCHKILQNVGILTNADRASLFLVQGDKDSRERCLVTKLFDVCSSSTVEEIKTRQEIQIPWGMGIVGFVAETGRSVNVPDAYQDPRFNHDVDAKTGYVTKSLLCMPIKDYSGSVIGVAQVINKLDGGEFTMNDEQVFASYLQFCGIGLRNAQLYERSQLEIKRNQPQRQVINKLDGGEFTMNDEQVFASYLQFCGIGLRNAQLYERSQLEIKRNQVLLDLARVIFEEQSTIEHIVSRIMTHLLSLLQCVRCQVLLTHEESKNTFTRVFDMEADDLNDEDGLVKPHENRFPIYIGITGRVVTTAETINMAQTDQNWESYFDDFPKSSASTPAVEQGPPPALKPPPPPPPSDGATNFEPQCVLCMPIKNSFNEIIGVIQLVNKTTGAKFTKNDENFLEAFAIFCGMGIHNTQMYERAVVAMAKHQVTMEVLSYHATAPIEEALKLKRHIIPSSQYYRLYDYNFDDLGLSDEDTLKACIRMFIDLDLVERFNIDFVTLTRWLLSVRKNYRLVTYHNWRHAFNVAQMMFAILTSTQLWKSLGDLECLSLMIGCLSHDLDHRGTNNSFQYKVSSPLARLYSTSPLEHHHFDQCLMILNSVGNEILRSLSPEQYRIVLKCLEDAILATDLAVYFRKRGAFFRLVESGSWNWAVPEHRDMLRGMLMTACDIAAITKPWSVQRRRHIIPSSQYYRLYDYNFDDLGLSDEDTLKACIRMFIDLDLVERFNIDFVTLTRWLLSVRKNYRLVTYHNWRHAFNVAQMMFAILTSTQLWKSLGDLECLSLMIGCLSHDLDHRGTNNSFQYKVSSPLARLYSTSPLEHHHFDQCLMILNSVGNEILRSLSPEQYRIVLKCLEDAILATDLAVYFRKRGAFFRLVESGSWNWAVPEHRDMLRGMLMTACDIAAITKPWSVQRRVAELVASEFFEQGDLEKEKFNVTPIDMMNREKKSELPSMQVDFIDSICLPVYQALGQISDKMQSLRKGVESNRRHWLALKEAKDMERSRLSKR
ncbi:unnamed protein product [Notodromas monacha]|uniref:Phosphodiesterase n=1 Tax=Notodromas monacha TaxID=399045 RepID=A0A7R9GFH6_9CRUS|nr:unnamed protein product [Notodromas monacha]CAG0919146.1 unnamed protein product [Notodromas monacha]